MCTTRVYTAATAASLFPCDQADLIKLKVRVCVCVCVLTSLLALDHSSDWQVKSDNLCQKLLVEPIKRALRPSGSRGTSAHVMLMGRPELGFTERNSGRPGDGVCVCVFISRCGDTSLTHHVTHRPRHTHHVTHTPCHSHTTSHTHHVTHTTSLTHHVTHTPRHTHTTSLTHHVTHHVTHTPRHSHTTSLTHHVTHTPRHSHTTSLTHHVTHTPCHSHTTSHTHHVTHTQYIRVHYHNQIEFPQEEVILVTVSLNDTKLLFTSRA